MLVSKVSKEIQELKKYIKEAGEGYGYIEIPKSLNVSKIKDKLELILFTKNVFIIYDLKDRYVLFYIPNFEDHSFIRLYGLPRVEYRLTSSKEVNLRYIGNKEIEPLFNLILNEVKKIFKPLGSKIFVDVFEIDENNNEELKETLEF